MKNLTFIFLFLSFVTIAQNEEANQCSISTKGVYYSAIDSISNIYIRFYEENIVYTTSSDIEYELATKYIVSKNHDFLMNGKFQVNKRRCLVRLKAENEFGKIQMEGIINDDKIIMIVINKLDNTSRDFIFNFYPEI